MQFTVLSTVCIGLSASAREECRLLFISRSHLKFPAIFTHCRLQKKSTQKVACSLAKRLPIEHFRLKEIHSTFRNTSENRKPSAIAFSLVVTSSCLSAFQRVVEGILLRKPSQGWRTRQDAEAHRNIPREVAIAAPADRRGFLWTLWFLRNLGILIWAGRLGGIISYSTLFWW